MHNDTLYMIFTLADMAEKPQCVCCVQDRTGQAGTLAVPPRDSGDHHPHSVAAAEVVLQDAAMRDVYVRRGSLTREGAVTRLRVIAYVASTLMPPVVHDYDGLYALGLWEDGGLPPLDTLEFPLRYAITRLQEYMAEHDAGEWVDPNAMAGAVVDVHDAALAAETWWSLSPTSEVADA